MKNFLHHGATSFLPQLNSDPHAAHLTHVSNIMEDLVSTTAAQSATGPPPEYISPESMTLEPSMPENHYTLVDRVGDFVKEYMSRNDASHDYKHVLRVLALAQRILQVEQKANPSTLYDPLIVTLSALLHDVGDHKYRDSFSAEDPNALVKSTLISFGATFSQASYVQEIVKSVSYSHEALNHARMQGVLLQHPELGIVQDADRLDAIGAMGIGRAFTYSGAKGMREMEDSIRHFTDKLENLEGLMKTAEGKRLAKERTKRLKIFREWWLEENAILKELK